jgi:hypothetical protein
MKRILFIVLAAASLSTTSFAASGSWEGWVSDNRCGAKVDAECSKTCLKQGATLVFVTAEKSVVKVTNPDALKDHVGQHVRVKGTLDKDTNMLTVSDIKPIAGN